MPPGFNFVHATYCVSFGTDPNNITGCIYSQEGLFVCLPNAPASTVAVAAAACANNHIVAVHIYDEAGDGDLIMLTPTQ